MCRVEGNESLTRKIIDPTFEEITSDARIPDETYLPTDEYTNFPTFLFFPQNILCLYLFYLVDNRFG